MRPFSPRVRDLFDRLHAEQLAISRALRAIDQEWAAGRYPLDAGEDRLAVRFATIERRLAEVLAKRREGTWEEGREVRALASVLPS